MNRPPAQYGDLLDQARLSAHRAQASIAQSAFASPAAARAALASRGLLLTAIAEHATTVLGPPRVQSWRDGHPPRRGVDHRDPRVRRVLAWIDQVDKAGLRCQPLRDAGSGDAPVNVAVVADSATTGGRVAPGLDAARGYLTAAGTLVATHHDIGGALAAPAPSPLARAPIGSLLASTLRVGLAIAPIEPLALRCRQAGLTRQEVDEALPLTSNLEEATWDLARMLRFPTAGLDALACARSPIDCSEPGVQWEQRMARIDRRLHRHELTGRVSVQTLRDVAYLGMATSHVLTTSGVRSTPEDSDATEQFKQLVEYLAPLRSTEPRDDVIRRDVQQMLDLAHPATTADDPVARARLLRAIDASVPVLDGCGERGCRLLAHTTDAWVPAKPHAPYLQDPYPSGRAVQRPPAPPVDWPLLQPPQMGPELA